MPPLDRVGRALARLFARVRSLWRGLRHRHEVCAEMEEEFRHHLALRTEDLVRRGLSPTEARRRAHLEFGHVEALQEEARAARGLGLFDRLGLYWLDVKLGMRMLLKYPGLSAVSVVGMAVAVAIGAGWFGFLQALVDTTLPLDDGERIVSIQNDDVRNPGNPDRRSLHDFVMWREELGSIDDLSAYVTDLRNLVLPSGAAEIVTVARMTASGFRVARVAPILGRSLQDEDERPGASPVVVVAAEEWRRLFDGDPGIIGRPVRLGTTVHTVVGVMPEGFRFPLYHRYWTAIETDPTAYELGAGPPLLMFGRLADGATIGQAGAEMETIGARMAASYPDTHGHLRPRVLPYTRPYFDIDSPQAWWIARTAQLGFSLLLALVAVNVAILVYARTATRTGEIAVRSALGASRRRVVSQLFAEALVLSGIAAAAGLTMAALALEAIQDFQERTVGLELPFWFDVGLSPGLIAYAAFLTVLGGVIVGVLPGLKTTGRKGLEAGLRHLPSRGSPAALGRTWTALIVLQVAVAVAALPYAVFVSGQSLQRGFARPDYPVEWFLRAQLSIEPPEEYSAGAERGAYEDAVSQRFVARAEELVLRLQAEPDVAGVTFASRFPGNEVDSRIEVEGAAFQGSVRVNQVDPDIFRVFDVQPVAGRTFAPSDRLEGSNAVVVDHLFADGVLGGGGALGRRVRFVTQTASGEADEGPWHEIVGVIPTFTVEGTNQDFGSRSPTLYRPASLSSSNSASIALAVRTREGVPPGRFSGRLREVAAAVDPALQLHGLRTAANAERERSLAFLGLALMIVGLTASVLLLSAAGIYAMMSFTVARRRREIGIRAALGAAPRRLLGSIFARAGAQLAGGALAGVLIALAMEKAMGFGPLQEGGVLLLLAVAGLMTVIGLIAALGPARRGLAIQPTEALKGE